MSHILELESGGQYANLVPSCINSMCILDLSEQMAGIDVKAYCVSEAMPKSDESVVSE